MSKDFSYLHHWVMGWPGEDASRHEPRAVILECIPSRSGMSLTVYDRGERIYAINGCGFDRLGCALAEFLEACFQPELNNLARRVLTGEWQDKHCFLTNPLLPKRAALSGFHTKENNDLPGVFDHAKGSLRGAVGFSSMVKIAQSIGLKVHQSESKAGTLIIIEKGN